MIIRGATLISRPAIIFAVLFAITACSGGGGGSSFDSADDSSGCSFFCPVDDGGDGQSVSLEALTSTAPGLLYTSPAGVAVSDDGITFREYTGAVFVENQEQIEFQGVLVTPRVTVITYTDGVASRTTTATSYFDASGFLFFKTTPSVTCAASSAEKLPASVSIGDSGPLSTFNCIGNTIQEGNWTVEDAGEGDIALVLSTTTKDSSTVSVVSTEVTTFTLDAGGAIVSFRSEFKETASGFELLAVSI